MVISTEGTRYATLDIKDFYLNSKLKDYKYAKIHIDLIPEEFIKLYNLYDIIEKDRLIYMEIRGRIHGLPETSMLAYNQLVTHLESCSYKPVIFTPSLRTSNNLSITFTLIVDGFGIKFTSMNKFTYLKEALEI